MYFMEVKIPICESMDCTSSSWFPLQLHGVCRQVTRLDDKMGPKLQSLSDYIAAAKAAKLAGS